MSIRLNKDLINIADLLKIKSSVVSWFNLINFFGDNSLKRNSKNIEIFTTDQSDNITLLDDGEIASDFIIEKGLELNDIKQFAPYIFPSKIDLTTSGFKRVDMSPKFSFSPEAIFLNILLIIFPDLVFGNPGAN